MMSNKDKMTRYCYVLAHTGVEEGRVIVTHLGLYSESHLSLTQDLRNGYAMLVYTAEGSTYSKAHDAAEKWLEQACEYNRPLARLHLGTEPTGPVVA